jgi:hypothetical protein
MIKKIGFFALVFVFLAMPGYSAKLCDLEKISQPYGVVVNHGQIYVLDKSSVIYIYSLEDFKYLKSFGGRGEGPGQFRMLSHMTASPDFLFFSGEIKSVFYSKDGVLLKEKKSPRLIKKIMPVGENFVAHGFIFNGKKEPIKICLLDKDFKILKMIGKDVPYTMRLNELYKTGKYDYMAFRHYGGYDVHKDKIFIADTLKGFHIEVFNHSGNKLHDIDIDYEKEKVTARHRKEYMARERESIYWEKRKRRRNYVFPEFFPAFEYFKIHDDYIYIFKHQLRNERKEVIVMDFKGKIIKKTTLPLLDGPHFHVYKNTFYYLFENEDAEMWELHSEKIF